MAALLTGSAVSPSHILQPSTSSTTNKPLAPAPGFIPVSSQLGPTKEWNIPPRPKPGRKPALDAPPTKRKAQNREAQRAFRERRAAKVGELEDQMKQMEKEDLQEKEDLRKCIKSLQGEVDMWQRTSDQWRRQSKQLEIALNREREAKQQVDLKLQILKNSTVGPTDAVPLRPKNHRHHAASLEKDDEVAQDYQGAQDMTCGKCSNDSRCECIEDAFKMSDMASGTADNDDLKRPLSPQKTLYNIKRVRPNECDEEPIEIDFTTYHPPGLPKLTSSPSMPSTATATDSCGFCQDGTPCICAEIHRHNETERRALMKADEPSRTKISQLSSACNQSPGSCLQCQSNPVSKDFCLSLAKSRNVSNKIDAGAASSSSSTAPTLNCADAFNQLAQHPAFPQASAELQSWVPQLATRSQSSISVSDVNKPEERTAFEIEAASIMNVLKSFDVRFGENLVKNKHDSLK